MYISVEVNFFDHPKTIEVGERLAFRHLRAIAWCHKNKTDGIVSTAAAKRLLTKRSLSQLVSAGLWEAHEEGWYIHDYLCHQQSRADIARASETGRQNVSRRYAKR